MLSDVLKVLGVLLIVLGTIGIIKQNEVLVKLHFAGISDTVGIILIIVAFALDKPGYLNYWLLFIALLCITGPISGIAIAKGFLEKNRRK